MLDKKSDAGTKHLANIITSSIPKSIIAGAVWCAIFLIIYYGFIIGGTVLSEIAFIVIPLGVSVLLAMALSPVVSFLDKYIPGSRYISTIITVVLFLALSSYAITYATAQLIGGMHHMSVFINRALDMVTQWMNASPIKIDDQLLSDAQDQAESWLSSNWRGLTNNLVSIGSNLVALFGGVLFALIGLIFFLADGDNIWRWCVRLLPENAEEVTYQAFRRGAYSLRVYVQSMLVVAAFDAAFIGVGALLLGMPLVIPLTILTFIATFIPLIGVIISGALAVLLALATNGLTAAIIMLAIVLITQQIEGNVLQPVILGSAVSIHPLAIILIVTLATTKFYIVGALFAVPLTALINTVMKYYLGDDPYPELGTEPMPEEEEEDEDKKDSEDRPKEAV